MKLHLRFISSARLLSKQPALCIFRSHVGLVDPRAAIPMDGSLPTATLALNSTCLDANKRTAWCSKHVHANSWRKSAVLDPVDMARKIYSCALR